MNYYSKIACSVSYTASAARALAASFVEKSKFRSEIDRCTIIIGQRRVTRLACTDQAAGIRDKVMFLSPRLVYFAVVLRFNNISGRSSVHCCYRCFCSFTPVCPSRTTIDFFSPFTANLSTRVFTMRFTCA